MWRYILNCLLLTVLCATACTGEESFPECISLATDPGVVMKKFIPGPREYDS